MRQQQTQKTSGKHYDVNIDPNSFSSLQCCQRLHKDHGNNFTTSVIVRRAIRAYLGTLVLAAGDTGWCAESESVISGAGMRQEIIETQRAAKGVL
jgi:hypothetical protein